MNATRREPWQPTWPHQIFELMGLHSVINMPNGRGKTTIVTTILCCLAGNGRKISEIRSTHFAPKSTGRYTHLRVQLTMDTESGAAFDMFSDAPQGQQMVFGVYGRSGENETYNFYSYYGTFEDCPLHRVSVQQRGHLELIADKEFTDRLQIIPGRFPSSAREKSNESWRAYVARWFDMTGIEQQINYQLKAGGEGKSAYFEVKPRVGMKYSAAVFYEHLAPQLLTNVMGDYGEDDEHGIEDTIHEKARKVVHAKVFSEKRRRQLEQTRRVLVELQRVNTAAEEIAKFDVERQTCRCALITELSVLRNIVIDKPIPGLPLRPPVNIPVLANYLVLCEGKPFMPDRAFEHLTGEEPKVINQRALRHGIQPSEVEKSQLLDIACDLKISERDDRGKPNKYYDLENTISLFYNTEKFLLEWNSEKAIKAGKDAFEWAVNADTNPARLEMNAIERDRSTKTAKRDELLEAIRSLTIEKTELFEERQQSGAQQAEYQRMSKSGFFTPGELDSPEETGRAVASELSSTEGELNRHRQMTAKQEAVYSEWQTLEAKLESGNTLSELLERLQQAEETARIELDATKGQRDELVSKAKTFKAAAASAREALAKLTARLKEVESNASKAEAFAERFPGESPIGLIQKVTHERDTARTGKNQIENELARLSDVLKDLADFKERFGAERNPSEWLAQRTELYGKALVRFQSLESELNEATISLDNLERFSIAPNKYVRDVTEKIGVPSIPLHHAVEQMSLNPERRTTVLSLFSGLLNAPVLTDASQAAIAARNLADNDYEFPVFVAEDLLEFCSSSAISFDDNLARSLFVGVRTRAVDRLLDPSLVEREKEKTSQKIKHLHTRLTLLSKIKKRLSSDTHVAKLATRAQHALEVGSVEKDASLRQKLENVISNLVIWEQKASEAALDSIRGALCYQKALGDSSLDSLLAECEQAEQSYLTIEREEQSTADTIVALNQKMEEASELFRKSSVERSEQEPVINRVLSFLKDTDYGLQFMMKAPEQHKLLVEHYDKARHRSGFSFDLSQKFVTSGLDRPIEIERRITEITVLIPDLDLQKTKIVDEISFAEQAHSKLNPQVFKIDSLSNKLIKLYRKYRNYELAAGPEPRSLDRHEIYVDASYIRASTTENELISRLLRLNDEMEDFAGQLADCALNLTTADKSYNSANEHFNNEFKRVADDPSLQMGENLKHHLEQAKTDPSRIKHILNITQNEYDKDKIANETAKEQLDLEWEGMAGWLSEFTQRLPIYFKTMKSVFAPKYDDLSSKVTHAGFIISGEVMQSDDVQAVMGDIVSEIEDFENHQRKSADSDSRKETTKSFRREIRNKFYQRILSNPTIKVCIPSISEKPLILEKEMASSGQGVAMTLLWIVKLADFVSERERQRKTVSGSKFDARSMVNAKKLRHIDSQFVFIDGAFSHLSDRALIEDVLKGISRTHGRFQLIVTGHDPDYNFKHNFKYFPTLLTGREISDRYMYVENGKPVDPTEKGSNLGAMELLRLHKIELSQQPGTAT